MPDSKQLRVFLCHASEDREIVRKVHKRLNEDGIYAWVDKENLLPGQDWRLEITKAVRNSDVVLVFLSKHSVEKKGFVQKEIKLALDEAEKLPEGKIFIVPILLEECVVPERLKNFQWVELYDSSGYRRIKNALDVRAKEIIEYVSSVSNTKNSDNSIPIKRDGEDKVVPPVQLREEKKIISPKKKINPTILAAIIGAIATILAGVLGSPLIEKIITPSTVVVTIVHDGISEEYSTPINSSVGDILNRKGIVLGILDRVEPSLDTSITKDETVEIVRVRYEYKTEQSEIPFNTEVIKNGVLLQGEKRLLKVGKNGTQELKYQLLYEDNVFVNENLVEQTILINPVTEVIMMGIKNLSMGSIAFLSGGNAWVIENPGEPNRNPYPVINTGDLDGRIFVMSSDGEWLLFSRKSNKPVSEEINTLWVMNLVEEDSSLIDLHVSNVIHSASFVNGMENTVSYSTVEPRSTSPGWNANNDLYLKQFFSSGNVDESIQVIGPNIGGIYGWWGINYIWSHYGQSIAYSRPDSIGIISFGENKLVPLIEITPFNTRSDWAFIPGLSWSPNEQYLYFVSHAPPAQSSYSLEESPNFDISVSDLKNGYTSIVKNAGMFAYPTVSPYRIENGNITFFVAYLQAENPENSVTSPYRLFVMDADGSNRRLLFPSRESAHQLQPQLPVWAPVQTEHENLLAIVYEGDIWLIDVNSGESQMITNGGTVVKIDWK